MPSPEHIRTALTGVRVFDGQRLTEPMTVVVDGDRIGTDAEGARVSDAGGGVLLPGLIDAHVHLHGPESLQQLASHGVTTGLDMATWPPELLAGLRDRPGVTDIRSAGTPAIGRGGPHARLLGMAEEAVVDSPEQAEQAVEARLAAGSDFLKLVLEAPGEGGPDRATAEALVAAAHARGLLVVAHAGTHGAYALAVEVGPDVITHVPLGEQVDKDLVARIAADGRAVAPTLTIMETLAHAQGEPAALQGALASVGALHAAGVPVLAGTDANQTPGSPAHVRHGESIHHELELLVAAGLSTAEALRAATSSPARRFGLDDRGSIAPGLRADLLLIDGDPLADIRATRRVRRIWCGGIEHAPA